MSSRYIVDTCALISYFPDCFPSAGSNKLSVDVKSILDAAFNKEDILLIFPSIVFVEIFEKWCCEEEDQARIKFNIFKYIQSFENMSIMPIDFEILENILKIKHIEKNHNFDGHDKIVLSTAMVMGNTLISSDQRLQRYNTRNKVIPNVIF